MTRLEIRTRFRQENPDVTDKRLDANTSSEADAILNSWLTQANIEFCTRAECIVGEETLLTVDNQREYDLATLIPNFYKIDDRSGGIWYDGEYLKAASPVELSNDSRTWRNHVSNGTPRKWYQRGTYLFLDKEPSADDVEIVVSTVYKPNDFSSDSLEPFNGIGYLEPFHYALVAYLQWKAKIKLGKDQEVNYAYSEFERYIKQAYSLNGGVRNAGISLRPSMYR
jgi:hypothetical protein